MKSNPKKDNISNQLTEIQALLKRKDYKPLNFVEAAEYLSISHSTLYKLTYQRKIPCHKPNGKYLYFFKHELDEWIEKGNGDTSTALSAGTSTALSAGSSTALSAGASTRLSAECRTKRLELKEDDVEEDESG